MTIHPARPTQPFTDPADWRQELDDLAAMAADAGFVGPLRDVLAHLIDRDRKAEAVKFWPVVLHDAAQNLAWGLAR